MKRASLCILGFYLVLTGLAYAGSEPTELKNGSNAELIATAETLVSKPVPSLDALQADWTFAGVVVNENDERYQYYVEIQRNGKDLHASATLINGSTKEVVLYEESEGQIDTDDNTSLKAGRIFLRYYPINDSWIFGVKIKENKGFNFKVDMLGLADASSAKQQKLRAGVELQINQTGHLNGHLQTGASSKEEFVTASKAWFRQVWVDAEQADKPLFMGVLCQFNDGSAFYSVDMKEPDAVKAAVAGWRNDQGEVVSMSQSVTVKEEKQGNWQIHISSPKLKLSLDDMLFEKTSNHRLIIGFTNGARPGFCAISKNELSQINADKTVS
ncbi:hypothetical protein Lbir_1113 [Legionella birminghamensis]|uniref:Uncharacterized protein n=1 Tax=Legionella birminghamensis TaxID=28083 RepID=A0A378IC61_9GAMM|nr:hypothetical protein [Legionella birminghamensis]KTC73061.1 hypothetical protein Lbir_1113 [Legionella birminghamensis]STX32362.1 Uncharacterised protein [Legionella birminghamensis]